jgi:hypothetical protein
MLHGDRCIAGCEAHMNFADESVCLLADSSQITGGFQNAADIPSRRRKRFGLSFETLLQEYLQFLPFGGYCCKLCPSNNPRRKYHKD